MTREVIYHLLEEAAESGRHYQSGLMAARRTASAHGGCTEFNIIGDALMEADNAIAAIEEMRAALKAQGINVLDQSFVCTGKGFLSGKMPSDADLEAARKFAADCVKTVMHD